MEGLLTILSNFGMNRPIGSGESRSVLVVLEEHDMFVGCNLNLIFVLSNLYFVYSHKESIEVNYMF